MLSTLMLLATLLEPTRAWYPPNKPIEVRVASPVRLVLTDFAGKLQETKGSDQVAAGVVDVKALFPALNSPGTYVLYGVAPGKSLVEFEGTPLVFEVFQDKRRGAPPGPMIVRVETLAYIDMTTNKGDMQMIFYYDVAPNTARSFLTLAQGGYFDGLTFHRIVPDFVIQGGDPRGDGTGSPGYFIDAEFNDRPHEEGALSMARTGDPNESPGVPPRGDFANTAGSQFFICLNYKNTQQLDRRYTVFGKVVKGLETLRAIGSVPVADARTGRPAEPVVMQTVAVKKVDKDHNPYRSMLLADQPAPSTQPASTEPWAILLADQPAPSTQPSTQPASTEPASTQP